MMSAFRSGAVLRFLFLVCVLTALAAAQTGTPVSLNFSGSGAGTPNSVAATGSGTMDPLGAANVTFGSSGASVNQVSVSMTFTFASGATLSAVSNSVSFSAGQLSGTMAVTGGTGQFAKAAGAFSFVFAVGNLVPPGQGTTSLTFTLTGSGSLNNVSLPSTSVQLPDATVGVPYTADIVQGISLPPGASFQLAAGASGPAGLTLSSSGLLSGTPAQSGNYMFSANYLQGTAPAGTLTITLDVVANTAPAIAVRPGSLNFSLTEGTTAAATQSIVIANSGGTAETFTATATTSSGGNWLNVSPGNGTVSRFTNGSVSASVDPALKAGTYSGSVSITVSPTNQQFEVSVLVTVSSGQAQLVISQSGLRFRTVAGGAAPPSQSVAILNGGSGSLNYMVSASTTAGGTQWLSISPASGTATAAAPGSVVVSIQPGLQQGDYYGEIQIAADGAVNSPLTVAVVLNVAAAGTDLGAFVTPTGLIFVGQAGGADPSTKTISVTNPSPANLTFTATSFFTQGTNWFTVQPASGVVNATSPASITVQPTLLKLNPGVYLGEIVLHFQEDHTARHIAVALIVIAGAVPRNTPVTAAASACTPTKLVPVFTQLGASFATVAAWPTPIEVTIVDDCGNLLTAGNVTASFSDSDPSLALTSLQDGRWSATWQPRDSSARVVITVDASELLPPIEGTQTIGGALQSNPTTPSIYDGGVVSAAKYSKNQPLAPGGFTSIYGVHLSAGMNPALSLPLATQLGATQVIVGGRQLPLQFAGDGQVNAVIPYDMPPNSTQQLILANGPALSVPQTIVIAPAQPAIFTQADGSGVVFGVKHGTTNQFLVDANHPVSAGDAIVIYCAGLGPVNPPVEAGSAAPSAPPATTTNPVTVTIGGKSAQVFFGGLVGGFAGLYQVNAFVPKGVTAGKTVPLVVEVAGFHSAPVTISVK